MQQTTHLIMLAIAPKSI